MNNRNEGPEPKERPDSPVEFASKIIAVVVAIFIALIIVLVLADFAVIPLLRILFRAAG